MLGLKGTGRSTTRSKGRRLICLVLTRVASRRLERLYKECGKGALRLAYSLTGDRDLADDIVQESLVRVASKLTGLRKPNSASTYFYRVVINVSKDQLKKRGRPPDAQAQVTAGGSERLSAELREALLALPLNQRAVLFFRHVEDLTEEQTAERLGMTVGAVKSLAYRARSSLRMSLKGAEHIGD